MSVLQISGISTGEINEGSSSFGVAIPSEQGEWVVPAINDGEPIQTNDL